jgi:hypothetical protein
MPYFFLNAYLLNDHRKLSILSIFSTPDATSGGAKADDEYKSLNDLIDTIITGTENESD